MLSACALALFATSTIGAQTLTTTFAHDSAGGTGWTVFFDLTVQRTIDIEGLGLNVNAIVDTSGSVEVFRTPAGASHQGNEFNPIWTRIGIGESTRARGIGQETTVSMATVPQFSPGNYGVAVVYTGGFAPAYAVGDGSNQAFGNADLALFAGTALSAAPANLGTLHTPRVWSGTIYYDEFARADSIGNGCGGGDPATFYEQFGPGSAPDLSGTSFSMVLGGAGYVVSRAANTLVLPTGPSLQLGDDETRQVALPWPLPMRAGSTTDLWICSNGFVSLEQTFSTTYNEWLGELLAAPSRICGLWNDFNPLAAGGVFAERDPSDPSAFHVSWIGVPEYGALNASSFQITFRQNGNIDCTYGSLAAGSGIVGFSHGNGSRNYGPTDLSDPMLSLRTGNDAPRLQLRSIARPVLGSTASLQVDGIPTSVNAGALLTAFAGSDPGIDLAPIGMPGCALHVTSPWPSPLAVSNGTATVGFAIGNDPALAGLEVWLQAVLIAPGENSAGLVTSNAVRWQPDRY